MEGGVPVMAAAQPPAVVANGGAHAGLATDSLQEEESHLRSLRRTLCRNMTTGNR